MTNRRTFVAGAGIAALAATGVTQRALAVTSDAKRRDAKPAVVIPAPTMSSLPVVGTHEVFPLRRIYCIGRNYSAHIDELQHDRSEPPLFFQKARDMIVQSGEAVVYPSQTSDYEHEVELVLAMKSGGMNIAVDDAMQHVYGYAVGLDMTRRDLQNRAQQKRQPWEAGKSFDQSAPCSAITPVASIGLLHDAAITLTQNGQTVTSGNIKDMIWNTAEVIAHLSTLFSIGPGDLIYTGTPKGVGKVNPGDVLVARIDGLQELRTPFVAA